MKLIVTSYKANVCVYIYIKFNGNGMDDWFAKIALVEAIYIYIYILIIINDDIRKSTVSYMVSTCSQ